MSHLYLKFRAKNVVSSICYQCTAKPVIVGGWNLAFYCACVAGKWDFLSDFLNNMKAPDSLGIWSNPYFDGRQIRHKAKNGEVVYAKRRGPLGIFWCLSAEKMTPMLISFFDKYLSTLQIDSMDSTLVKAGKKEGRLPCNVEILPSTTTTNSLRDLHFNVAGVGKKVLLPDHFF